MLSSLLISPVPHRRSECVGDLQVEMPKQINHGYYVKMEAKCPFQVEFMYNYINTWRLMIY